MVNASSESNRMNLRLLWIKRMSEVGPDHVLGRIEMQEDIRVFNKETKTGNVWKPVCFLWRIKKPQDNW